MALLTGSAHMTQHLWASYQFTAAVGAAALFCFEAALLGLALFSIKPAAQSGDAP